MLINTHSDGLGLDPDPDPDPEPHARSIDQRVGVAVIDVIMMSELGLISGAKIRWQLCWANSDLALPAENKLWYRQAWVLEIL